VRFRAGALILGGDDGGKDGGAISPPAFQLPFLGAVKECRRVFRPSFKKVDKLVKI